MIQEHLSEYVFDGDGRPVIEKEGFQTYHVNDSPPNSPLTAAPKMYQVWSTVLGSNLTTVKPDETKWETKIFAGGAVIAKEGATGPHWMTSDPVTGTTVTWRKIDNDWRTSVEETEPLGQKIYNADPDPLPDPSYDNSVGNADYPQWQCQMPSKFYGNFYAMPWHCQFAEIKRRSFEGGHYVIEEPETNPNKVSGHSTGSAGPATPTGSAGHETGHMRAFNRIMNYTLGATRKPAKDTGEQAGDDEDPIRVETHTSRAPLETGWVEPGDDTVTVKFSSTSDALSALEEVVKGTCKEKINELLRKIDSKPVGYSNPVRASDIFDLFENISTQSGGGGLFFDSTISEINAQYQRIWDGKVSGAIAGGGGATFGDPGRRPDGRIKQFGDGMQMYVYVFEAEAGVRGYSGPLSKTQIRKNRQAARMQLTRRLIEELIHAAGTNKTINHSEMDLAALAADSTLTGTPRTDEQEAPVFGSFLRKHCGL
ncbi:MAG: hypothetical protein IPJ30_23035 [Acidobacteria bacterium]|nr:hypothetical protein [Acidobacteriota bacterium]